MSILAETAKKAHSFPTIQFPKWPKFNFARHIADALQVYADAVSIPYGVAMGFGSETLANREAIRRKHDY